MPLSEDKQKSEGTFSLESGQFQNFPFEQLTLDLLYSPQASPHEVPATPNAGPTDGQWHIASTQPNDINVEKVWPDYTGHGVTVAVMDEGVQYTHPEFAGRYNAGIDYDYVLGTEDGINKTPDAGHGTSVAGVIAAANDGVGTTGVAYGATITSFRLLGGSGFTYNALSTALQRNVDVSNNSWGWATRLSDGGLLGSTVDNAMRNAVTNNRNGLGTIIVQSAGNGGSNDNANYSELKNNRFSIVVGAGNSDGTLASFSTPGASVLLTAPGTQIYTTDLMGADGYNTASNYTTIQGTSFSSPIVAGVVALMLEANSGLGYRDIQEILAYSSRQSDLANASWEWNGANNWNGGGLHISENFGYGFVDAASAVRLSETWLLGGRSAQVFNNEASFSLSSGLLNQTLNANTFTSILNINSLISVEHVELQLDMTHNRVQDLLISLTSPDGTNSIMFNRPTSNLATTSYDNDWSFSSIGHWGELAAGNWQLSISDTVGGGVGTLNSWTLRLFGDASTSNDTYVYTDEYARFTGDANASRRSLSDNGGTDTINASALSGNMTLNLNTGNGTLAGNALSIAAGTIIENAYSGDGNDALIGNTASNMLFGGRGNDTLDGGLGIDTLIGGKGDDTYFVDSLSDVVTEALNEGYDVVYSAIANYVLSANVELLQLITGGYSVTGSNNSDNIKGNSADNVLYGMAGNDTLDGGTGNDTLDGGLGTDSLIGGNGNDLYIIDNTGDIVSDSGGIDTIESSVTWALNTGMSAYIENLTLTGSANINGTGNTFNNLIEGNSGNNILNGYTGTDTLLGGAGDDIYIINGSDDVVTELANEGLDRVESSVAYTIGSNIENIYLTGALAISATGNELDNFLFGNSAVNTLNGNGGNDTLNGGAGADALIGGTGNDFYVADNAGDTITELTGEGIDSVDASVTYTLSAHVENLTLKGAGVISGTGNASANMLTGNTANNTLSGLDGDDSLDGGLGNDTLLGGNGNDTLNAMAGNDSLTGGQGDDTYLINNILDTITELANEGTDTVHIAYTYTLGNNLENLAFTGILDVQGFGNALNNSLTGNAGNNFLDGKTGVDTMAGGTGDDIYIVDNIGDVATENANEGTDNVKASVSYTLGANIEKLTLTGTATIDGTGNALGNTLTGNDGNNTLYGLDGNDSINGGLGDDTLYGGNGNDTLDGWGGNDIMYGGAGDDIYYQNIPFDSVVENANEGTDTVYSNSNHTLSANVENLYLTGALHAQGIGNELANIIGGNDGNNLLIGNAGNDTLIGGLGNDTLKGGIGADTYRYIGATAFGADVIIDGGNSGGDVLDLGSFNTSSVLSWQARDSAVDTDSFLDSLYLDFGTYSLLIQDYFGNMSVDDDMSLGGAGLIETINFSNTTVTLAAVQNTYIST